MLSPRTKFHGFSCRALRWLLPTALLALTPKCVLCVLVYVGLGTALGLGGPEMCGGSHRSTISWATTLAWAGVAGVLGTIGLITAFRRMRSVPAAAPAVRHSYRRGTENFE